MMEAIRLASEITTTVLDAMSVDELREFGELYGIEPGPAVDYICAVTSCPRCGGVFVRCATE